ncbi:MAG: alpha/beta hydrolase [Clostridiales bacterium]|nr:alpha/beta hydrolase [Clostridiales bacterium]
MVFDPKPIIEQRTLLDPIPTADPKDFPHTDEVPEGCIVLKGVKDNWGHKVDLKTHVIYAERDGRQLELNIFIPKEHNVASEIAEAPHKWPCVVYVQGSAFHEQWIWDNIGRHIRLAQRGYVIAVVQYRPSEVAPFPAQMQDAKTAIRFMRKNAAEFQIDPDRVAVAGDSSGGHTALMTGFTGNDGPDTDLYGEYSAEVKCIVDVYGPTVFALMNYWPSSQNHWEADSPEGFEIGQKNVLENPELANATIPMNYLSKDKPTPPLLTIHGGHDMLVPFNQSCQLYKVMKEMGKDMTFYKLDDANHGCLGFDSDTVLDIVDNFLKEHL